MIPHRQAPVAVSPRQRPRSLNTFCADDAGAELVEFALAASVFLVMLLGFCDVSRALYLNHFLAAATGQAGRYAMVRGATAGPAPCADAATTDCQATAESVAAFVMLHAPLGTEAPNLLVETTWPAATASGGSCTAQQPGCLVEVRLTYRFHFLFPFLPQQALSLTGSSATTISR